MSQYNFFTIAQGGGGGGGGDLCLERMGEGGNKGVLTGREVLPPMHYIIFAKS